MNALTESWRGRAGPPPRGEPAQPVGFPDARFVGDDESGVLPFIEGFPRRLDGDVRAMRILALSGGGAGGAFGAGALAGLTRGGARPVFDMVTGVSTGALIAPFAFIGPEWDERLRGAFTDGRASELMSLRGLRAVSGLYGPEPLAALVAGYIDGALLCAVAKAHAEGRRLYVATANLDAQYMTIWDMGAIAARGGDAARDLFREVLAAAASLPGIFAPRMITVETGGRRFQEMHADGGVVLPLFVVPEPLILRRADDWCAAPVEVYALVNTTLQPSPRATPMGAMPILVRGFELMLRSSYRNALRSVGAFCEINGFELRVASVPEQFGGASMLRFDARRMSSMFEHGLNLAASGGLWSRLQ